MALRKIDAEILWSERSENRSTVVAGVRCRFSDACDANRAVARATIEVVRVNVRSKATAARVNKRVINAAWDEVDFFFNDDVNDMSEANIFLDVSPVDNVSHLTPDQEESLQQELDGIERDIKLST